MKIVLSSALYPPDIAAPAPYVKELARHLEQQGHEVEVVTYGRLPEQVPGVRITAIDKRQPLPWRLMRFAAALLRSARGADLLYTENGPSVELPAGVVARLQRVPLIVHMGDEAAHERAERSPLLRSIERFAIKKARSVLKDSPMHKPEILPFEPPPTAALEAWKESWRLHLETVRALTHHAH